MAISPFPIQDARDLPFTLQEWFRQLHGDNHGALHGIGSSINRGVVLWDGTFGDTVKDSGFSWPVGTPSNGQVLSSLNTGVMSWTSDIPGNAQTVTTNADLTGPITSTGNATAIASQTGTGTTFVMSAGPEVTGTLKHVAGDATYVGFHAASGTTDTDYRLPLADGSNTWVLSTDGSGNLSWTAPGGGGGTGIQSINGSTANAQTIAAGTGISVADSGTGNAVHTIAVNQAFSPTWTGTHAFTKATNITISTGNVPLTLDSSAASGAYLHFLEQGVNGFYLGPIVGGGGTILSAGGGVTNLSWTNAGNFAMLGGLTTGGRIGLGTVTPSTSHRLTVESVSGESGQVVRLRDGTATRYRSDIAITSAGLTVNAFDDTGSVYLPMTFALNKFIIFTTAAGGAGLAERMRVTETGVVCIGTTSGTNRVTIFDNSATNATIQIKNTNAAAVASGFEMLSNAGTSVLQMGFNNSTSESFIWNNTALPIKFGTSNTERMRIGSLGDITIQQTLGVVGLITAPSIKLQTGAVAGKVWTCGDGTGTGSWQVPAAGSGTVTNVSVVSANGFSGSVANPTTTPAITLSTSVTGILKGAAGAISSFATAGTGGSTLFLREDGTWQLPAGSIAIGSPIGGSATPTAVLYVDALSKLAQDVAHIVYDPATFKLTATGVSTTSLIRSGLVTTGNPLETDPSLGALTSIVAFTGTNTTNFAGGGISPFLSASFYSYTGTTEMNGIIPSFVGRAIYQGTFTSGGTPNVGHMIGVLAAAEMNRNGRIITGMYPLEARLDVADGTVRDAAAVKVFLGSVRNAGGLVGAIQAYKGVAIDDYPQNGVLSPFYEGSVGIGYGVYSDLNLSTGGTKYNIYAAGTAPNVFAGNVGITTATPGSPLSFGQGVTAQKILLYENGTARFGFGIQANELRTFFPTGAAFASFGTIDTADGTTFSEKMRIDVNGQVTLRGGSPGAGKVLTSDASGLGSWQPPSGALDTLTIRDFGAVIDGTTSDSTAVQNCINAAAIVGGTVYFNRGLTNLPTGVTYNNSGTSVTGSISGTVLTVTAILSGGIISPLMSISGAGIPDFTSILSLGTGVGGIGTYNINRSLSIGSETITCAAAFFNGINFKGSASNANGSVLLSSGAGAFALSLTGNSVNKSVLSDFQIFINASGAKGISLVNIAGLTLENIVLFGLDIGLYLQGVQYSVFKGIHTSTFGRLGVQLFESTAPFITPFDTLKWYDCHFQGSDWGMQGGQLMNNSFYGCRFEGCGGAGNQGVAGHGGADLHVGSNGSAFAGDWGPGLNFDGLHVESNTGEADIKITNDSPVTQTVGGTPENTAMTIVFKSCSFFRTGVNTWCTNFVHIVNTNAVTTNVVFEACSFAGFNDYVASAGRPYVGKSGAGTVNVYCVRCTFGNATEKGTLANETVVTL